MRKNKILKTLLTPALILLISLSSGYLSGCRDNEYRSDERPVYPPDPNKETGIVSYFPDSGGIATQLIIYGTNLGTDTSYLKVTVNKKNAPIVSAVDDIIYAIVPARADTGYVEVFVGKGEDVKRFAFDNVFRYQFRRNVTTICGQQGEDGAGTDDGDFSTAKLRRPWYVTFDRDGVLYFIDEGRGISADGGLRMVYEGEVTTLLRNSEGPMQSPTCIEFNPAQDTLYLINSLWNQNSMSSTAAIATMTRETGFLNIKPFVQATRTAATAIAVHPKNGEIFYNSWKMSLSQGDGYIYQYDRATKEQKKLYMINNEADAETRMLFSRDGKTLYIMVRNRHVVYRAAYDEERNELSEPTLWLGSWNNKGYINGSTVVARFDTPSQAAMDEDGNLYIADKYNHCIRKVTPDGMVSTYAGAGRDNSGYLDGDPSIAKFNQPEGIALGPDDGLYVADRNNHMIRRIMVE